MNERIKQITGQVLDELVPETWVALGYDKIKEIQNRTAELIVRECENSIKLVPTHFEAQDKIIVECLKAIRETFRS